LSAAVRLAGVEKVDLDLQQVNALKRLLEALCVAGRCVRALHRSARTTTACPSVEGSETERLGTIRGLPINRRQLTSTNTSTT
jgi:hypothetical protein